IYDRTYKSHRSYFKKRQVSELSSPKAHQRLGVWYGLDLIVANHAREAVEYALMEAGALGTETNDAPDQGEELLRVTAYFDQTPERERLRAELSEALRIYELPSSSVREMNFREVPNQDWLGEWKRSWQPVELGRLVIAPPWSEVKATGDRVVIRIEPGMAFGTGTHETTRLCLKAIMRFFKGGSFLDVGTGTGILAIAAAKLFPEARIAACDTDPDAVEIARENARLNGVDEQIEFRVGSLDESCRETATASADFVCANLTAAAISTMLPALVGASCGRLVLSGILDSQVDAIIDQLHGLGDPGNLVMMQDGEWVALVV
ncbi:MAG: 50S ribosomal protein L11 methyltransferase, partial [Acidobacteriota bacterium]|nr:50S ribosomal protein L11 methyltransferase [Acidobacteriota bacterium]